MSNIFCRSKQKLNPTLKTKESIPKVPNLVSLFCVASFGTSQILDYRR